MGEIVMKVKVKELIPGCILQENVFGKSGQPIVYDQTVLTKEHIQILEKFLIKDVHISNQLADGTPYKRVYKTEIDQTLHQKNTTLKLYDTFLQTFAKQYEQWQLTQTIDIALLRQQMLPLIKKLLLHEPVDFIRSISALMTEKKFYFHQTFSSYMAAWLAKKLGYRQGEVYQIFLASLLKDSSFIKWPASNQSLETTLNGLDREKIKEHPILSYRLVENSPLLNQAAKISILQHEERQDGSGYPLKLKGNKIHRYAKIIALCDLFTKALIAHAQKGEKSLTKVITHLKDEQKNRIDLQILQLLSQYLTEND